MIRTTGTAGYVPLTQRLIEKLLPPTKVLLTDFGMTEGAGMITATQVDATDEDRLERDGTGGSVAHLVKLAGVLQSRGIDLRVLHQGIDTSTPGGRLTVHILAGIAEFERDLISECTRDGLAAARTGGPKGGCRPALSAAKLEHARELREAASTPWPRSPSSSAASAPPSTAVSTADLARWCRRHRPDREACGSGQVACTPTCRRAERS